MSRYTTLTVKLFPLCTAKNIVYQLTLDRRGSGRLTVVFHCCVFCSRCLSCALLTVCSFLHNALHIQKQQHVGINHTTPISCMASFTLFPFRFSSLFCDILTVIKHFGIVKNYCSRILLVWMIYTVNTFKLSAVERLQLKVFQFCLMHLRLLKKVICWF